MLATHMKTQEIGNPTPANPKEESTHITTNNNKNKNNNSQSVVINIISLQWSQFIYKRTQANGMVAQTGSSLLMHKRNTAPLQMQTSPQSKGLEKIYQSNRPKKQVDIANPNVWQK